MKPAKKRRLVLGVTGGVGCGKSEVGRILERWGWAVCDADDLAHEALAPGGAAYGPVVEWFGARILAPDGTVARDRLAQIVFQDARARAELNARLHPVVCRALREWLEGPAREKDAAAIVPLLFEAGWTAGWTAILCVVASDQTVRERLARRGWSEEESLRRIAAQWPLEEKKKRADYVIKNDGTLAELERAVRCVVDRIGEQEENKT